MVWHAVVIFITLLNGELVPQEIKGGVPFISQRECLVAGSAAAHEMVVQHSDIRGYTIFCERAEVT